jgi:4-hydroxy-tetrahydrodipicolinate reductase
MMNKVGIVLVGYGKMGQVVAQLLSDTPDVNHAATVGKTPDADVYAELSATTQPFDAIIDFSHHSNIEKILRYAKERQKPLVICTTGFSPEQEEKITRAAEKIPIVYSQNMSIGINVMLDAVQRINDALGAAFDVELIEAHHNLKEDAPSGTAKMLLAALNHHDNTLVYGREGYRRRTAGEIGVHAVRGGTIVGEHTVLFAGADEMLEVKHTALSKKIFAAGALRAVRFIVSQPAGLYRMADVLKQ